MQNKNLWKKKYERILEMKSPDTLRILSIVVFHETYSLEDFISTKTIKSIKVYFVKLMTVFSLLL